MLLVNAYNAGIMYPLEQVEYSGAILGVFVGNEKKFKYANVYYENADGYNDAYGIKLPQDMMQDGTLAYLLHDYYYEGLDASVWGQNIDNSDPQEGDLYPRFGKKINGASTQNLESVTMHTGNDDEDFSLKYVPGYLLQLPEMSREGTAFLGWYDNAEYNGTNAEFIPTTATGPQEFWARFAKVWTISYWTGNEVTHIGENVQSYAEGVGVTLPKTVTQSGAVFNGWYDNKNLNGPRYYKVGPEATGDKQFYAKWLVKKEPAKDADGCYVIKDASELYGFAAIVNGTDGFTKNNSSCASLASDIVVNENVLKNDGSVNEKDSADFMRWTPMKEFMGVFDGKGHAISGLYYNVKSDMNTEMTGVGLIGSIRDGSFENPVVIKNVGVEASYFGGVYNVGALVGLVQGRGNNYIYVNISNSYSTSVTRASTNGGGLVGLMASNVFGLLENCYNVGKVFIKSEQQSGASLVGGKWGGIVVKNSYYLNYFGEAEYYGKSASGIQFENGTVAYALHNGENGSIWGQNVGEDPLPNFSGVVKNFTNSSSSSVSSSSSAKSSSSLGTSSSGKSSSSKANPVSSSGAKPSSSSAKAVSSSSGKSSSSVSGGELSSSSRASVPLSFGILCNGKKCNDALLVIADVPSFRVMAAGRKILVRGARVGSFFAVFDIQGQLIQSGYVGMADLAIIVPRSGHYLVRIGNQTKNVLIR